MGTRLWVNLFRSKQICFARTLDGWLVVDQSSLCLILHRYGIHGSSLDGNQKGQIRITTSIIYLECHSQCIQLLGGLPMCPWIVVHLEPSWIYLFRLRSNLQTRHYWTLVGNGCRVHNKETHWSFLLGFGYSWLRKCPKRSTHYLLFSDGNRWFFSIGIIMLQCWSIASIGNSIRNAHHLSLCNRCLAMPYSLRLAVGSSRWIIVFIRSCTVISLCEPLRFVFLVRCSNRSPFFSWFKW